MKKQNITRLLVWALIAAMPLWFGSCSKSGTDAVTPSSIEGTWRYSGLKVDPAVYPLKNGQKTGDLLAYYADNPAVSADFNTCFTTTTLTFITGGKITGMPGQKCTATTGSNIDATRANSTWKLEGTKLTLTTTINGISTPVVYDTVLNGNTLKLLVTDSTNDYDGDGKKDTITTTIELTKV